MSKSQRNCGKSKTLPLDSHLATISQSSTNRRCEVTKLTGWVPSNMLRRIKQHFGRYWIEGQVRSHAWATQIIRQNTPNALLDVGCGDGIKILQSVGTRPNRLCGIEAAPTQRKLAEQKGIEVVSADLNGRWPYRDGEFDVVHAAYIIEHLHNTRLFVSEAFRVLKPGGTFIVLSENLCSFMNWSAMTLGYTPFTLVNCCGMYIGNPLGLYAGESLREDLPIDDPSFPGATGHVRALSVPQARDLFERIGFVTEASSIGLLPLPDRVSPWLEWLFKRRGHFLLIKGTKPKI